MESVALYSFQATESDELAFNKGDTLKVRWPEPAQLASHGMGGVLKTRARTAPQTEFSLWRKTGPASPVIKSVTPDNPPPPSEPQFPHLRNGEIVSDPSFGGRCEGSRRHQPRAWQGLSQHRFPGKNLKRQLGTERERKRQRRMQRDRERVLGMKYTH